MNYTNQDLKDLTEGYRKRSEIKITPPNKKDFGDKLTQSFEELEDIKAVATKYKTPSSEVLRILVQKGVL